MPRGHGRTTRSATWLGTQYVGCRPGGAPHPCVWVCQFGLSRGVIFPTYGLAENTVFVASNGRLRLSLDRHALEHDGQVRTRATDCKEGGARRPQSRPATVASLQGGGRSKRPAQPH